MTLRVYMLALLLCAKSALAQNTAEVQTSPSTAVPQMNVPASPLPSENAVAPSEAPLHDPELEITAVEVDTSGAAAPDDERLKPFKSILDKLAKGAAYRVISQEAKTAPLKTETNWTVNSQYSAFVLPMEQTSEGAVRLDARVSMNSGGKMLNALRAEGEVPPRKVMAFRGLDAGNGNELVLFLRQAPGDQQDQGGGDSGDTGEQSENEPQDSHSESAQAGEQGEEQPEMDKDETKDEPQPKEEEQTEMAKAEEKNEDEDSADAQQDDQTIAALLKSLEEEDQRQQQEARFNRQKIIIPPSGEWW